jgi:hypothetical protein
MELFRNSGTPVFIFDYFFLASARSPGVLMCNEFNKASIFSDLITRILIFTLFRVPF